MRIKQDISAVYVILNTETNKIRIDHHPDPKAKNLEITQESGMKTKLIFFTPEIYEYKGIIRTLAGEFKEYKTIGNWYDMNQNIALERLNKLTKHITTCKVIEAFKVNNSVSDVVKKFRASRSGVIKYLLSKGIKPTNQPQRIIPDPKIKDQKEALSQKRIEEMIKQQRLKHKK